MNQKLKWVMAIMLNDENSSDDELVEYFSENGLTSNQAGKVIALRNEAFLVVAASESEARLVDKIKGILC